MAAHVAEQDRPGHAPIGADDELAVRPRGVGAHDLAGSLGGADRHEVDAHDLELGARHGARVGGFAAGQRGGGHGRLVVDRRDDAVDDAAVLSALADRQHALVRGHHAVVDDDPALDGQAGRTGQVDLRADADRDHDEVGLELGAVGEAHAANAVGQVGQQLGGLALEQHLDAERLHRRRQQRRGAGVELALHQAVHEVHDGRRAAVLGDAARRFEPEQAAADDDRSPRAPGGERDRRAVLGAAEHVDAAQVGAGDRRHERIRAGAQHGAPEVE